MLNRGIELPFKIFGVPVRLHWSYLIILPWFTYVMAMNLGQFAGQFGLDVGPAAGGGAMPWVAGFVAALLLGLSILVHEFGHILTARAYGAPTESVTLWALGGLAALKKMPRQPGAEAVVAIVGPITSLAVGAVFGLLYLLVPDALPTWKATMGLLGVVNVGLAVFNMIPALPLDGGRVLRSLLGLAMPFAKATQIAGTISRVLAGGLVILALFGGGFWLLLIAFFIFVGVGAETRQATVEQQLRGLHAGDLMTREVVTVPPDMPMGEVLRAMMARRLTGFPVAGGDGRIVGTIGLQDYEDGYDADAAVSTVMRGEPPTVAAHEEAVRAFEAMAESGFGRLVVVGEGGQTLGILSKADVMRAMQVRAAALGARRRAARLTPANDPLPDDRNLRPVV